MGTIRLPRYVQKRTLADGRTAYYWCAPSWAKKQERNGRAWTISSEKVGTSDDLAEVIEEGDRINEAFDSWKAGEETGPARGSVDWLFAWYRTHKRFTKLKAKTQKDYRECMDVMATQSMKRGVLGEKLAAKVNATVADTMYERIKRNNGPRKATYVMQVCRIVWNLAKRHNDQTGIKSNPFASMRLPTAAAEGNRETSREEYDLYRETARELGYQSMATAAALAFGFGQRASDVFGYREDKDRNVPPLSWAHYTEGETFAFVQNKRGKKVIIPLTAMIDGELVSLYPDVEEELERTPRSALVIVVEERNGLPYTERRMSDVHREICDKAGLPKEMTFTGFRHGGLTEIGDAGVEDARSIGGHSDIATGRIYDKITAQKAKKIGMKRLAHIRQIEGEVQ